MLDVSQLLELIWIGTLQLKFSVVAANKVSSMMFTSDGAD